MNCEVFLRLIEVTHTYEVQETLSYDDLMLILDRCGHWFFGVCMWYVSAHRTHVRCPH